MLSSIRVDGSTECLVFDGATDKKIFAAYMEEVLLPVLHDGDIIIMDNLSVHKNSFDVDKFKKRNIEIKYLPAYSPDLNPIEKIWSKIKTRIREHRATDTESLFLAIKDAFSRVTASNAKGWFQSCGYF
jgi:transposase